ncbi:MAG TPA: hypothetical protein VF201_08400 [Nitrolancea sp.]
MFATSTVALPEPAAGDALAAGDAAELAIGVLALGLLVDVDVVAGAVDTLAPLLVDEALVGVDAEEPQAARVSASSSPTLSRVNVDRGLIRRFIPLPFLVMLT